MNDKVTAANRIESYRASSVRGAVQAVDFSIISGKRYAFFQLEDAAQLEALQRTLTATPLNQKFVATTNVLGKPMLITCGNAAPQVMLGALSAQEQSFEKVTVTKHLDAWTVRSILGTGGQSLQMAASFLRPPDIVNGVKKFKIDSSIFVFAAANLAANGLNFLFHKGTQIDDKYQLLGLKQKLNRDISPSVQPGEAVPDVHDHRLDLRPHKAHQPFDEAKGFLKHHSVAVSEIGLRIFGALALAFPVRFWKEAWVNKTFPKMDSPLRVYAGLSSVLGKTIALSSKIPDPYNPKPRTAMDAFREDAAFKFGSVVEMTSFGALAYDAFVNSVGPGNERRSLLINGKMHRDWLGGVGGLMFVAAYVVRFFAKFGERKVDMGELCAHASDVIAATPADKSGQLLANTAASLAEHFAKESPDLTFAAIYTQLANDFAQQHGPVAHTVAARKKIDNFPINQVITKPGSMIDAADAVLLSSEQAIAAPVR